MFLAQSVERAAETNFGVSRPTFTVLVYRVELAADGRPVWRLHRDAGTWRCYSNAELEIARTRRNARRGGFAANPGVPFVAGATPGRRVTRTQAMRLTGMTHPMAALDFLHDRVEVGVPELENYVKPKRPPKPVPAPPPPPTPVELAERKLNHANARLAKWVEAETHAVGKQREWRREVKRLERRIRALTKYAPIALTPADGGA